MQIPGAPTKQINRRLFNGTPPNLTPLLHLPLRSNHLKQIHSRIITTRRLPLVPILVGALLGSSLVDYARHVFDRIPNPRSSLYDRLISAYTGICKHPEALAVFVTMHRRDVGVGFFTAPPVVKSCTALTAVEGGRQVHCLVVKRGIGENVHVQSSLMDLYAKAGDLGSARRVFDGVLVKDPVSYNCLVSGYLRAGEVVAARELFHSMGERTVSSWNTMISGNAHNGEFREALTVFEKMVEGNVCPNEKTLASVLSVCAKVGDLPMALRVKKYMDNNHWHANMILSTALLELYVKCGAIDEAQREFEQMKTRDVVAWSTMIAGYALNGRCGEALKLFELMLRENVKPDAVALVSVLSACSNLGSTETSERLSKYVEVQDLALDMHVASALVHLYSQSGNVIKARIVFDKMVKKDIVSWNTMIMGLATNGCAEEAIDLHREMIQGTIEPDDVTFVGLLTGCARAGLIEKGLELFKRMQADHQIKPQMEHYACIVDLYSRSGRLEEAHEFICKMELEPNVVIWGSLLAASRTYCNVELAELCAKKLLELEPRNHGNYIQLCNMYASGGRWPEALAVRNLMKDLGVPKTTSHSWIN